MIEKLKPPRIDGDELIIETQSRTEVYDSKYLLAALLLYVARGDSPITENLSQRLLALIEEQFAIPSAESLELLTRAMSDFAENPDMESLLRELSAMLSVDEKEDFGVLLLKVAAAEGPKDADEMERVQKAADVLSIPADVMHKAYDRYFKESGINDADS